MAATKPLDCLTGMEGTEMVICGRSVGVGVKSKSAMG